MTARIPILYLDTSVLGGYFDDEFKDATRELWRQMGQNRFRFITSVVTGVELIGAPSRVRRLMDDSFTSGMILDITPEMEDLALAYMQQAVLTPNYSDDARHVAACTVAKADYLVSWNFRHLVSIRREKGFNGVNHLRGYHRIRIVNPLELIHENEEENL